MNKQGLLRGQHLHNLMLEWGVREAERRNRTPKTIKKNKEQISSFLRLLGDREFTAENCNDVLDEGRKFGAHKDPTKARPWSIGTVRTYAGTLRAFTKWAVIRHHLYEDFSPLIIKPQAEEKDVHLIARELAHKIIIEMTEPGKNHHRLHRRQLEERRFYLLTLLWLGLRSEEPFSITKDSLSLDVKKPTVSVIRKGRKKHVLPIPKQLRPYFQARRDWLEIFTADSDGATKAWKDELAKRGIPHLSPHKFRHMLTVEELDNGAPITRVQQQLNHSSVKVTGDIYAKHSAKSVSETFNQYDPLWVAESNHEDVTNTVLDWLKKSGIKNNPHVTTTHEFNKEGVLTVKVIPVECLMRSSKNAT